MHFRHQEAILTKIIFLKKILYWDIKGVSNGVFAKDEIKSDDTSQ
jgi:hypothetical protein